jgi:hypothetical protein
MAGNVLYFFGYSIDCIYLLENALCSEKLALLSIKAGLQRFFFSQSEDAKWQRKLSDMLRILPSRILFALPTFKIGKHTLISIHGTL